jgi:hypothetical protein
VATKITTLSTDRPIVEDDGSLTAQSRTYFRTLTVQALIIGEGSPESFVDAEEGATYQDKNGIAGAIRYAKKTNDIGGDKKLGWVLI